MSKRRFFQMHLSTAVVLMLVAGVLVWANVRERPAFSERAAGVTSNGWPFVCQLKWTPVFRETMKEEDFPQYKAVNKTDNSKVIYNALIALAILLAVWQVCEWRIRRKRTD